VKEKRGVDVPASVTLGQNCGKGEVKKRRKGPLWGVGKFQLKG